MVLQKKLDYGFNGYHVPIIPRAPRSARKRISIRKKDEVDPLYAFDLLATVAGELLLEDDFSPASILSTGQDQYDVNSKLENLMKVETIGQSNFLPEISLETHHEGHHLKDFTPHQNDVLSELPSVITTIGCSEKVSYVEKSASGKTENEIEGFACKEETSYSGFLKSSHCKLDDETKMQIKTEPLNSGKMPLYKDRVPCSSFPSSRDVVNIVSRDDDENSSMCTYPSTTLKSFRPPPRIVDRKLKKILTSKYWKVAPRLKDEEVSNASRDLKPIYRMRKTCYERQRFPRNYPFKKKRLCNSISNCKGIRNGGISRSFQKGLHGSAFSSVLKTNGANGTLTSAAGQNSFFHSRPRDSHVKLRINSFTVPEFFIEMPETATVASLKRRVMEAVSTILGGGLRVGVLLQEKKVKDDNKTLLQTGIAHDNRHDAALGFALEPVSPLCTGGIAPSLLPADASKPLTRSLPHQGSSSEVLLDSLRNNLVSYGDHDSAPSPTTMMSIEKRSADSKSIDFTPTESVEALSMIPMHRKSNQSDTSQRRTRRPFSVSEVEALVQAVEKLGTGRWRDVKSRAFDNAKHRTYVDLKDKWKTLVHTARIAPQQRRGEPVPQILLDRVLAAHSYWTQQQAKQQLKNQSDTCFLF